MEQPDLFCDGGKTEAYARTTDPETSRAAAASVRATELEARVYECLKRHKGGLTSMELSETMGLVWNSISPRMKPLAGKGLIRDSGRRKKGPSGRHQIVWVIA